MSLTLRRLTALEEGKLRSEHAELSTQISSLQLLMTQDSDVYAVMKAETLELRQKHALPRRSEVVPDEGELTDIDLQANDRYGTYFCKHSFFVLSISSLSLSDVDGITEQT